MRTFDVVEVELVYWVAWAVGTSSINRQGMGTLWYLHHSLQYVPKLR